MSQESKVNPILSSLLISPYFLNEYENGNIMGKNSRQFSLLTWPSLIGQFGRSPICTIFDFFDVVKIHLFFRGFLIHFSSQLPHFMTSQESKVVQIGLRHQFVHPVGGEGME